MKNTHHRRDHTTIHRTPCIHLSNSHCRVFTKAYVPTRHQCEPLARCNQTHLAELWLCHGRRWRRCWFWSLLIAVSLLPQCPLPRFQSPPL